MIATPTYVSMQALPHSLQFSIALVFVHVSAQVHHGIDAVLCSMHSCKASSVCHGPKHVHCNITVATQACL